jgi:hypothetical protein
MSKLLATRITTSCAFKHISLEDSKPFRTVKAQRRGVKTFETGFELVAVRQSKRPMHLERSLDLTSKLLIDGLETKFFRWGVHLQFCLNTTPDNPNLQSALINQKHTSLREIWDTIYLPTLMRLRKWLGTVGQHIIEGYKVVVPLDELVLKWPSSTISR